MWTKTEYYTIGFAGCGQMEFIAGCAILLRKEKKKLLLMDYSKTGKIRSLLSLPKEMENAKNFVFSYRDIDYIHADDSMKIQDFAFDYDVVLVDFGGNLNHTQIELCNDMFYITDMRRHNVLLLKEYEKRENANVILKHFLPSGEAPESIAEELRIDLAHFFVLPYEEKEMLPFLCGTPFDKLNFRNFGYETKKLIHDIIHQLKESICEIDEDLAVFEDKPKNRIVRIGWKGREHVWS